MRTTFPGVSDLSLAYRLLRERGHRQWPSITYQRQAVDLANLDDVHLEIDEEDRTWHPTATLYAFSNPNRERHILDQYGGEEDRLMVLSSCVPLMMDASLATQDPDSLEVILYCQPGDRFWWGISRPSSAKGPIEYRILEVERGESWGNTDLPLWYNFISERFRDVADIYAPDVSEAPMEETGDDTFVFCNSDAEV